MLFAESEVAAIITAVFAGIGTLVAPILIWKTQQAKTRAEDAKTAAAENTAKIGAVQATLKAQDVRAAVVTEQIQEIKKTGDVVHKLVNGQTTEAKRTIAGQARKIAGLTNSPADILAAIDAEDQYRLHRDQGDSNHGTLPVVKLP